MLQGIVYIQTNKNNTTLYTGVTRDLRRRVAEHKLRIHKGFSHRYNTDKLVYYEVYDRLDVGIHREKQLKKWRREWKEKLINESNPEWRDLAENMQSVKEAKHRENITKLFSQILTKIFSDFWPQATQPPFAAGEPFCDFCDFCVTLNFAAGKKSEKFVQSV